ncbi:MAG: hypothetical protein JOY82_12105 [Streptosporangiaceae bacterium]|nr:hypothetical protein [Streptosporangiaceae bacterium]MBV9855241.1 hypothetical protein [Streptosporangiaceae bacterium]
MITADLRRAIARAAAGAGLAEAGDPGLRPGGAPGRYASSVALGLAATLGRPAADIAGALATRLRDEPWIAEAAVTGPAYLTVTVTPQALALLPGRIAEAGPACAHSDALRGRAIAAPPPADLAAAPGWEEARKALAAELTARLAAVAGATVTPFDDSERTVAAHPVPPAPSGASRGKPGNGTFRSADQGTAGGPAGKDRYGGERAGAAAESVGECGYGGERAGAVTGSAREEGHGGDRAGAVIGPPGENDHGGERAGAAAESPGERGYGGQPADAIPASSPVAAAIAFAGLDAVRFALARAAPGRPVAVDPAVIARHVPGNPAYAVRYAHSRAASGLRWVSRKRRAAEDDAAEHGVSGMHGASAPGLGAALPRLPADPGERALLDALSWLPERVAVAARRGRPDEFARYLEELAYTTIDTITFSGDAGDSGGAGPRLAAAARAALGAGLELLGISAPDRI